MDAFLIVRTNGDILIRKNYRGDNTILPDIKAIINNIQPITMTSFVKRFADVIFIATFSNNVNVAMIIEYFKQLQEILLTKLGKITVETIENNMTAIYELLDETMEFGYPQITNIESLNLLVPTEKVKESQKVVDFTNQITGAVVHRKPGLKYKSNEIFIDVEEHTETKVSKQSGTIATSSTGSITFDCYLTGMPECKLAIDKGHITNFIYHPCVKDATSFQFVPPDGEFILAKYISENASLPVKLSIANSSSSTKHQFIFQVTNTVMLKEITVTVPTPHNYANYNYRILDGQFDVKIIEHKNEAIIWKLKNIAPGQYKIEFNFRSIVSSGSVDLETLRMKPIILDYKVNGYNGSGFKLRALKIHEPHINPYIAKKWVRYSTTGRIEYR